MGFQFHQNPSRHSCVQRYPPLLYHHHAHACWLLLKLGLAGNRLLDKAIIWIKKRQRNDGGWLHRTMVKKGRSFENQTSCIWITVEILQLLCARYSFAKSKEFDVEKVNKETMELYN